MPIRVAINGFGRIGRFVVRAMIQQYTEDFEIVAINDLAPASDLAYLLKYDTTQGRFPGDVSGHGELLTINGHPVETYDETDPAALPWRDLEVDVVIEATGHFRRPKKLDEPGYDSHLDAGAKRVIITAPTEGHAKVVVLGVNDDELTAQDRCVSNASCTTNSLAPVVKVLHEAFTIEQGLMVTVHAYTGEQRLVDAIQLKDLRRGRAAAANIVPTTTNAAQAIGQVIRQLKGKLDGYALRVPVPAGSITDLTVNVRTKTDAEEVNEIVKKAAQGPMEQYVEYSTEPIVSSDIIGNPHSSIFDSLNTRVIDGTMVKCTMWYDNEWGYSCRTAELAKQVAGLGL